MIRLIMKMTGGPTDPQARVEYTSWEAVDQFAKEIASLYDTLN
jgi:menaquinone-dependent protoporphyrinogen oxidase